MRDPASWPLADRFGRLSEKRIGSSRIQRFEYDAEHRLIEVHQQNGALRQSVVFGYDPLGRRISKQMHNDDASEPSSRTLFHWQGLRLLEEVQDGRPSLYMYANPGSEDIFYFHTNLAGLPEQLTDTGGNTVWHSEYQAWGKTRDEWHDQQPGCTTTPSGFLIRMWGGLRSRIRLGWRAESIYMCMHRMPSHGLIRGA